MEIYGCITFGFFLQTNGKFGVVNGHKQMKSNERMDEKKNKEYKTSTKKHEQILETGGTNNEHQ